MKNVLLSFKRPFITQLNPHVFVRLSFYLKEGLEAMRSEKSSVREVVNFVNSLHLLGAQIGALRECKLSINECFVEQSEAKHFIEVFKQVSELPSHSKDKAHVAEAHQSFMTDHLEPVIIKLMSISMDLLYTDIGDILSELKGILTKRIPASELSTNEQSQLCVIFDNLSHKDSITKLLRGSQEPAYQSELLNVITLLFEFSLAGVLDQISRIKFSAAGRLP